MTFLPRSNVSFADAEELKFVAVESIEHSKFHGYRRVLTKSPGWIRNAGLSREVPKVPEICAENSKAFNEAGENDLLSR